MEMEITEDRCRLLKENGNGAIPSRGKVREGLHGEE